jgi:hypothetical protein
VSVLASPVSARLSDCILPRSRGWLGVCHFICRSPFYLCLEHVDNLGAYSIPSGDRLLIPSDFVNSCKMQLLDKLWNGCRAEFAGLQAWRMLLRINRQNLKWLVRMTLILLLVWGGRDSGRPLRPQAFAMGGFDSGTHSFADILSCHSSHGQGRETSPSESLSFRCSGVRSSSSRVSP